MECVEALCGKAHEGQGASAEKANCRAQANAFSACLFDASRHDAPHSKLIVRAYDARHPGGAFLIETFALPFIDDVSSGRNVMRHYPSDSPRAAARIVVMSLIADGHIGSAEMEELERRGFMRGSGFMRASCMKSCARSARISRDVRISRGTTCVASIRMSCSNSQKRYATSA